MVTDSSLADIGIPVIALLWPLAWLALAPVVGVEWLWLVRGAWERRWAVLKAVALSNLATTFIGVPVVWAAMLVLGISLPIHGATPGWIQATGGGSMDSTGGS